MKESTWKSGEPVNVSDEDMARCDAEGGCALVTKAALKRVMGEAFDAGVAACKAADRNRT